MKIGGYEIFAIETGRFALDGGAMFGVVPKVLWEKSNPPDEKNRIELALRCLLLRGNNRIILIDTGIGFDWEDKFKNIYKIYNSKNTLIDNLSEHKVSAADITDVILTHLHFDHTGGTTYIEKDDHKLTFPNAIHHVQEEQWEWALNPADKDRASFVKNNFLLLERNKRLNKLNASGRLFDDIDLLVMYGHTQGMQLVKISDNRETLLFCSDLIPTASHISVPWVMAYDNNPLTTIAEKKRLLPQAFEERWILFFEHDPFRAACQIINNDKGFVLGNDVTI